MRLRKAELVQLAVDAIRCTGYSVNFLSDFSAHPAELLVTSPAYTERYRLFIWNVTHGGGNARADNEYRIQATGVNSFLPGQGASRSLILGWHDDIRVFATFDPAFHRVQIGRSPSLQISLEALESARDSGFGFFRRATGEIAVAVRWDVFPAYLSFADELHRVGAEAQVIVQAEAAQGGESLHRKRERLLRESAILARDARFRGRVMSAYGYRCAMCGLQLGLLDAAHIVPVDDVRSSDLVTNGIALCALHHRAYDRAIVTMDDQYRIHLNPEVEKRLRSQGLDGGWRGFAAALRSDLLVPEKRTHWPDVEMIVVANELRGWV